MAQSRIDPNQIVLNTNSMEANPSGLSVKLDPSGFLTETVTGIQLTPDNVGVLVRETVLYGPLTTFEVALGYVDFITSGDQANLISSAELQIGTPGNMTSPDQIYGENFTIVWDSANQYKRITWDPAYALTFGTAPTTGLTSDLQVGDYLIISYYRLGTTGDLTPAAESIEQENVTTSSSSFTQMILVAGVQTRERNVKFSVSGARLNLNGNSSVDFRININNGVSFTPGFANGMRYTQNLESFHFECQTQAFVNDGLNDFRLEWRTQGGNTIQIDQLIFNILEAR